ncbi:hypothetical protein J6J28_09725 [Pseudidiomarina sp. 1ASP75-5]|nr:hypothetical protein [Pseudidiomarina sp. 1ASP75-5]
MISDETKAGDISQQIRRLLSDSSLVLDGDWGEGKTYFAGNTFVPDLNTAGESCVLLSLSHWVSCFYLICNLVNIVKGNLWELLFLDI